MARYNRVVQNIEKCFRVYEQEQDVQELTFHAIKDWLNSHKGRNHVCGAGEPPSASPAIQAPPH